MRNPREFLTDAIERATKPEDCDSCGFYPCPEHAAEAVLDACRREDLFILERAAADEVIEAARGPAQYTVRCTAGGDRTVYEEDATADVDAARRAAASWRTRLPHHRVDVVTRFATEWQEVSGA